MLEDQTPKNYFSVQFPGKLPDTSKIKHIYAIAGQNSIKLETLAPLSLSLKAKAKKITFLCSFPAKYLAFVKSSIAQPLLNRVQHNLKLKFPLT